MKILGTLALLWLITFVKANEDQSGSFNEKVNEESSSAHSSSSSTSSSSSFQEQKSLSQEQESSAQGQQSYFHDKKTRNTKEEVFLLNEQQSSYEDQISKTKKQTRNFKGNKVTSTTAQEKERTKNVNRKTTAPRSGRPESVWIDKMPDSKVYDIVEVDNKYVNSRTSSQTVTSKHETDNKTKVVKEYNTRQPGRPESVWIGDTPDSKVYDIVEVDNKIVDSRTSSQTVTSKQETDNRKKIVKENNIRQPGRPESVWIGDTPDSKVYDIVEVNSKKVDSRTSSQTVNSKHETDNRKKIVKENNIRQPGRPESVWIGDTPDSKVYDIVEVDSKKVDSRTSSQTVNSKHETNNRMKIVKETNTRQSGQPESVWVGDTPDQNEYDQIIDVSKTDKTTTTAASSIKSSRENHERVKNSRVQQPNVPIRRPYPPHRVIPKPPVQSRPKAPVQPDSNQPQTPGTRVPVQPKHRQPPILVDKKPIQTKPGQPAPNQSSVPGAKPLIQHKPDLPLKPGTGPIIHPTPGQQPISIPYPPTQTNPPGPKTPIQPTPDQPPNPGPGPINQPTPAQPMPIPYPPTQINPPGPKPPIQLDPNQPPNPGPGPVIHPTPAQPPVPISNSPTQPNPVKRKCRRRRKPEPQQTEPGFDEPVTPPVSVWFGETPDPKDYTIYYINKEAENDECDYYDESTEEDSSVTETNTSVTETDTSETETEKYVKALRLQLALNIVFGVGQNGECHCTCSSMKPPYFISIPRDKIKGYSD